MPQYSDLYVPLLATSEAANLALLRDPSAAKMNWEELTAKCKSIALSLQVSSQIVEEIEKLTKKQCHSELWYTCRAGRVTASNLKSACRTDPHKPSVSLIKRLWYPKENKFSTKEVRYGRKHEKDALAAYKPYAQSTHANVKFKEAGFKIPESAPYFGATQDLLVECDCCGLGTVEESKLAQKKSSCIRVHNENLSLVREHDYFYQAQGQMYAFAARYSNFVLWCSSEVSIERILRDDVFISEALAKASAFFCLGLLPELVGQWYTRGSGQGENTAQQFVVVHQPAPSVPQTTSRVPLSSIQHSTSNITARVAYSSPTRTLQDKCCICGGPEEGKMIKCDSEMCPIGWYHFACIGLKAAPRKKHWYCRQCQSQQKA